MINLSPSNKKLKARMISIVMELLDCDSKKAENLLNTYQWNIKTVMEESRNEM